MTAIVGVLCKDDIVIGTDSAVTFGGSNFKIIEQKTEKIEIIEEKVIIAGCGSVGLNQRFREIVRKMYEEKEFSTSKSKTYIEIGKKLSKKGIDDFRETYSNPGQYGALVAFPFNSGAYLCELDVNLFQPEFKNEKLWYVSMGSSQYITDTFLSFMRDVYWLDNPPIVERAIFSIIWTIDHAIQVNPGGVNGPVCIAVLKKWGNDSELKAKILSYDDMQEHREYIDNIKEKLRKEDREIKERISTKEIPPI